MVMQNRQYIIWLTWVNINRFSIHSINKYYNAAVGTNTGLSDTIDIDCQSGLERGITTNLALLADYSIFEYQGIVGVDQGTGLQYLCIGDEMISYIKRIRNGLEVNEEKISFEEIRELEIGGNFLMADSTLKNFKKEIWFPDLFTRNK